MPGKGEKAERKMRAEVVSAIFLWHSWNTLLNAVGSLTVPSYAWEATHCLEKVFGALEKHLYSGQRSEETKQFLEQGEPTCDHNSGFS